MRVIAKRRAFRLAVLGRTGQATGTAEREQARVRLVEANYFCSDDQGKFTYWSRVS